MVTSFHQRSSLSSAGIGSLNMSHHHLRTLSQMVKRNKPSKLMSRRTRSLLPMKSKLLKPQIAKNVPKQLDDTKQKSRYYYNRGAKDLTPLTPGDTMRIEPTHLGDKEWKKAKVIVQPSHGGEQQLTTKPETAAPDRRKSRRAAPQIKMMMLAMIQLSYENKPTDIERQI